MCFQSLTPTACSQCPVQYRFQADERTEVYDIRVSQRGAGDRFAFTLQVFANLAVALEAGPPSLPYCATVRA